MTDLSLVDTQALADELINRCDGLVLAYAPKTNESQKGFITYIDGEKLPTSIGLLVLLGDRMNALQNQVWESEI